MTTFRSTAAGSDEDEENSGASDDEKTVVERILMNRPKVIAKRRFPGKGPDANDGQDTVQVEAEPIETDEGKNGIQNSLPKVKPSNAGELWADTAIMQTLEEKIGSGSSSTIADLHDRGVETYARDLGPKPKHRPTAGRKRRRPDDISDSIWDEQMGEEESASGDQGKPSDSKEEQIETDAKVVVDPVVDLWEGVDTGAVELPIERQGRKHHNQWHPRGGGRGRGRGDHGHGHFKRFKQDQGQSQHWNREKRGDRSGSGSRGQSRNRQNAKEFVPVTQFLPRRLVAPDYDQKKLFETVLDPEALNEEQLVNALVEALGEKQPTLISKLVEFTGKHLAVELFKECQEVEKRGGMLTKREDRRKTPGGVFMQLFNQREEISAEHKKALFALGSELMKQNNSSLWWNKKKGKKQQQEGTATNPESSPPPIIENEDLPRCSEIFKPNTDKEKQQEPSDATNSNGAEPMN